MFSFPDCYTQDIGPNWEKPTGPVGAICCLSFNPGFRIIYIFNSRLSLPKLFVSWLIR